MVVLFANQDVGQRPRTSHAAGHRSGGRRRPHHGFTLVAGLLGPDDLDILSWAAMGRGNQTTRIIKGHDGAVLFRFATITLEEAGFFPWLWRRYGHSWRMTAMSFRPRTGSAS